MSPPSISRVRVLLRPLGATAAATSTSATPATQAAAPAATVGATATAPAAVPHVDFDAPANVNLLLSARGAGLLLPASCRNGTCRVCMCKLLSGHVDYLIEWPGLLAEEKAEGWILPCVALPRSDLVIDQPAARRMAFD